MKKFKFIFVLLAFASLALTSTAELYTQSLSVGENKEDLTQYKEDTNNAFYEKKETPQDYSYQMDNPYVSDQYYPTSGYSYTTYYPTTSIRRYSSPYRCFKAPCPMPMPPQYGHYPPINNRVGGPTIYTNFAGGFSYGGDVRQWSAYPIGGAMGRPPIGHHGAGRPPMPPPHGGFHGSRK